MIKICPDCSRKYPEDIDFCAQDGARLRELQDENADPLVGRVLDGRWVIEKKIGAGGMGSVYLGSQRSVDRKVAIKTLKPELSNSREFVERFFREARVASKISHPNSVTILDFGQASDDTLYLAMEFLEGMPLTDRLQQNELPAREIIEICIQISSALAAAHANQIIHRDLKPDNIYLLSISDESTFIKVLDFGIAKVIDADEKMTQTGQVFGTPEYMSPEQCRGDAIDGRSDLYSLGCILYRMLTGRPPFKSETPMAVLVSHVSEIPRHVNDLMGRADIPPALTELCMKLLAKSPDDRPDDAQAVRAMLEEIQATLGSPTSPSAVVAPGVNPSAAADPSAVAGASASGPQPPATTTPPAPMVARAPDGATGAQTPQPALKRSPLPIVLGLLAVLVLGSGCVLGGFFLLRDRLDGDGALATYLEEDGTAPDDKPSDDEQPVAVEPGDPDDEPTAVTSKGDSRPNTPEDSPGTEVAAKDPNAGDQPAPTDNAATAKVDSEVDPKTPDAPSSSSGTASAQASGSATATNADSARAPQTNTKADPSATKTPAKTADKQPPGSPTAVEIHADTVTVTQKNPPTTPEKTASSSTTSKAQPEHNKSNKSAASGKLRQVKLSTAGDACLDDDIESVLKSAQPKLLSCYHDVLSSSPDARGEVMLTWNIMASGDTTGHTAPVSAIKQIDSCLLSAVKRLRFESSNEGRCYVRVTYAFSP